VAHSIQHLGAYLLYKGLRQSAKDFATHQLVVRSLDSATLLPKYANMGHFVKRLSALPGGRVVVVWQCAEEPDPRSQYGGRGAVTDIGRQCQWVRVPILPGRLAWGLSAMQRHWRCLHIAGNL